MAYILVDHKLSEFINILIYIFPLMVMCAGLTLLLKPQKTMSIMLLIFLNALNLVPSFIRFLKDELINLRAKYKSLGLTLNVSGFDFFYQIEWKALKKQIGNAFAFAAVTSFGDYGIIKMFAKSELTTLPLYISQQLDSHRIHQASFTAFVALIISLLIFQVFYDKN
jgi:thiamine transport system permease protein